MEKETILETILEACKMCNARMANNCQCRKYGEFCLPVSLFVEMINKIDHEN